VTEQFLATLGVYGGSFAVAFVAGLFPVVSIEVFLVGLSAITHPSISELALCVALAATGHQIAKSICYYAGVGALEHGKVRTLLDKHRARIDRWTKHPNIIMTLGAVFGLPPLYLLAFIAHPILRMRFWVFTGICFGGRIGRFAVLALVPKLF
jgi:membrane protein YqaA with SNARE-associated domain